MADVKEKSLQNDDAHVIERLRAEAIKHSDLAAWYRSQLLFRFEAEERLKHRTCLGFIYLIEQTDEAQIKSEIEKQRYILYNDCKFLQAEGFERLSENEMIKYQLYGELSNYFE